MPLRPELPRDLPQRDGRAKRGGCSGRVLARPANGTLGARLAYWVLSHPFGVSTRSFRTQPEGYADTIPYPVFKRGPLLELRATIRR